MIQTIPIVAVMSGKRQTPRFVPTQAGLCGTYLMEDTMHSVVYQVNMDTGTNPLVKMQSVNARIPLLSPQAQPLVLRSTTVTAPSRPLVYKSFQSFLPMSPVTVMGSVNRPLHQLQPAMSFTTDGVFKPTQAPALQAPTFATTEIPP